MDERKVREKMSKSIPGGSSKDLDALIAQYNKDLMNYYRKNASRILPTEETAPGRSASRGCRGLCAVAVTAPVDQETATQPAAPVMDFPVPIVPRPAAEPVENPSLSGDTRGGGGNREYVPRTGYPGPSSRRGSPMRRL